MTSADAVWNRAALGGGGPSPQRGDRALANALLAHGMLMNGGLAHCVEALTDTEYVRAIDGFRYLGAREIADILEQARGLDFDDPTYGELIDKLDADYVRACPEDEVLLKLFETKFRQSPEASPRSDDLST